jgi:hypothetical protein
MEGRRKLAAERAEQEKEKVGTLRGGSAGALVGEHVLGICHRIALARFKGLQSPIEDSTRSVFEAGETNEVNWTEKLTAAWKGKVTGDKDYPLRYEVRGVPVTGRPDVMLLDVDGQPVLGMELKNVESYKSAASLLYEDKPKTDNLIQAAHYSLKFGVPWVLVYTYNGISQPPYWAVKQYQLPKGAEVKPFKKEFRLFWRDGQLGYVKESGEEVLTIVTAQSIDDFYELVLDVDKHKDLYLRHSSRTLTGEIQPFDQCNYCPAKAACDSYDEHNDYDLWFDELARDWGIK